MTTTSRRPSLRDLLWKALAPLEDDAPVFWTDSSGLFAYAVETLDLPRPTERLSAIDALRLRVLEDRAPIPAAGRLFYLRSKEAIEPAAEIAHCFGEIKSADILDLLRQVGIDISAEISDFAQQFTAVMLTKWDSIPAGTLGGHNLKAALAAAVTSVSTIDGVDIAIGQLRRSIKPTSARLASSLSDAEHLAALERELVFNYLSGVFGLGDEERSERGLLRVAIVSELTRLPSIASLVDHLVSQEFRHVAGRLAERLAIDTKLVKALASDLEVITEDLGIQLDAFSIEDLLRLRLLPAAHGLAVKKVSERLSKAPPAEVLSILRGHANIIRTDESMAPFRAAIEFDASICGASVEPKELDRIPEWYLEQYTERWYKVDEYYRKAMVGAGGSLRAAIETTYRTWLRDLNVQFAESLSATPNWTFQPSQRSIGKSFEHVEPMTAIVVLDACRYELACDVATRLGSGIECDRRWAVAMLPSVTQVGMSALTPSSEPIGIEAKANKLSVLIGNRETTQKASRNTIWEQAGFKVANPNDVSFLSPTDSRVVVFHGAVDALGEKLQDNSFGFFEQLVIEISQLIRELVIKGYKVVAVADHGFLTLPPQDQGGRIEVETANDEVKKRRYRVSADEQLDEPIVTRTAEQLGFDGSLKVGFAPANSIFSAHGALTFLHGGITLQEMVIPHFIFRSKTKIVARSKWKVSFPKWLLARAIRVSVSSSEPGHIGATLELGVFRADKRLAGVVGIFRGPDEPLVLTCLLPEEIDPGPLRLIVAVPGLPAIEDKVLTYEPQRD